VVHDVINVGHDRSQLARMAKEANGMTFSDMACSVVQGALSQITLRQGRSAAVPFTDWRSGLIDSSFGYP
jgi:hypothetical protein